MTRDDIKQVEAIVETAIREKVPAMIAEALAGFVPPVVSAPAGLTVEPAEKKTAKKAKTEEA